MAETVITLSIYSVTTPYSIAIADEAGNHLNKTFPDSFSFSECVSDAITKLCADFGTLIAKPITLADISRILILQGPGGYTGIRIGVTVANTLAQALNIPITACDTLSFIARYGTPLSPVFFTLIPARRGELCCAMFGQKEKTLHTLTPPFIWKESVAKQKLQSMTNPTHIIGIIPESFTELIENSSHITVSNIAVSASDIIRILPSIPDLPLSNRVKPLYSYLL